MARSTRSSPWRRERRHGAGPGRGRLDPRARLHAMRRLLHRSRHRGAGQAPRPALHAPRRRRSLHHLRDPPRGLPLLPRRCPVRRDRRPDTQRAGAALPRNLRSRGRGRTDPRLRRLLDEGRARTSWRRTAKLSGKLSRSLNVAVGPHRDGVALVGRPAALLRSRPSREGRRPHAAEVAKWQTRRFQKPLGKPVPVQFRPSAPHSGLRTDCTDCIRRRRRRRRRRRPASRTPCVPASARESPHESPRVPAGIPPLGPRPASRRGSAGVLRKKVLIF